jgi:hypothetical protein
MRLGLMDAWTWIDALIVVLVVVAFFVAAGWALTRKRRPRTPYGDDVDVDGEPEPAELDDAADTPTEIDEPPSDRTERVIWPQGQPLPPRAGEIPENPPLPQDMVKIRCLSCHKKMRAPGIKFSLQRRCPNCHASPFRYLIVLEIR